MCELKAFPTFPSLLLPLTRVVGGQRDAKRDGGGPVISSDNVWLLRGSRADGANAGLAGVACSRMEG